MNRRRLVAMLGALAGLMALALPASAAQPAVVSRIDHLVVEDSQAAELFKLLTEQFHLPVLWPVSNFGSFRSGGVFFGNAAVEVGHLEGATDSGHAQWQGISFASQDSAAASIQALDTRHILHDPADDYAPTVDGKPGPALWTRIQVRDKGQGKLGIGICDYHSGTKAGVRAAADDLARNQGGPLGLVGVKEVSIETSDWLDAGVRWQKLLAPLSPTTGTFSFEVGPALHLLRGRQDAIRSLTLEVHSLAQAQAFLSEQGVAFDVHGGELTVQQGLHGLVLHLVADAT